MHIGQTIVAGVLAAFGIFAAGVPHAAAVNFETACSSVEAWFSTTTCTSSLPWNDSVEVTNGNSVARSDATFADNHFHIEIDHVRDPASVSRTVSSGYMNFRPDVDMRFDIDARYVVSGPADGIFLTVSLASPFDAQPLVFEVRESRGEGDPFNLTATGTGVLLAGQYYQWSWSASTRTDLGPDQTTTRTASGFFDLLLQPLVGNSAVPAPAAVWLTGLGAAALAIARRRR